ncbi:MAG TPA: phage integrase SAM-like domain-containing protein, partial [Pirellulales bacterium]
MRAWTYQDFKQVAKYGADKASHYVGWVDPKGRRKCKSCGPGSAGRRAAERMAEKITAQMLTGTYDDRSKRTWQAFVDDYTDKVLKPMKPGSRSARETTLKHFKRLAKPTLVGAIDTKQIDGYIAARKLDRKVISPSTINHELRELRAVLRKAAKWGYLAQTPEFNFQKEPKKLTTYVTP